MTYGTKVYRKKAPKISWNSTSKKNKDHRMSKGESNSTIQSSLFNNHSKPQAENVERKTSPKESINRRKRMAPQITFTKLSKAVNTEPTQGKWTAGKEESSSPSPAATPPAAAQKECSCDSLTVKYTSKSETETTAHQRFDIRAEFKSSSATSDPAACDFRQLIQGYWKYNGVKQALKSTGSGLTVPESGWVDDGYTKADDTNSSDTIFETNDSPGGGFSKTVEEDYYLKFKARIIDANNSNAVKKEKAGYWIRIKGKYPREFTHGGFDS